MEKIDRLGWAAGLSVYAYGLRIGIRVNKPEVLEKVRERLPPGWEPGCSPFVDALYSLKVGGAEPGARVRNYTLLYGGLEKLARTMNLDEALDALEGAVQMHVAEHARNRVFVHAGVVGWQGRAILLPGRSMAGKSTLVTALLRAGASYYSDEYAVLDAEGRVHPFPRRLSLRQADGTFRRCTAEELGGRPGTEPLPVGLVAMTRYHPGSRWQPRPMSPGKAVLAMMDNTVPAEHEPEMVLDTLEKVAPAARTLTSLRGEADETAAALLEQAGL
jgi:hypothetical protein